MVKLNRPVDMLDSILEKIYAKIEVLQDKKDTIYARSYDYERDLTEKEEARIEELDEQIDELQAEADEIENALDYLREYAE